MIIESIAACMILALTLYALSAGADFGGGVWDLLASGKRKMDQKKVIADAIGPIWESNHVWLIFMIVILFTGFPAAFASIALVLHVPLLFVLIGIVFRGAAFVFRAYASSAAMAQRWGRVFAIASTLTPISLGIVMGGICSGNANLQDPNFIGSWLHPFGFSVGLFALALFAFLAAVYLTRETNDRDLQHDFRKRALIAAFALGPCAVLVYVLAKNGAPYIWKHLSFSWWTWPLQILTAIAAVSTIVALWKQNYRLAVFTARMQVTLILWGWAFAQFPYLFVPHWTINNSAAPQLTLELLLIAVIVGAAVLVPSFYFLMRVFKSETHGTDTAE